MQFPASYTELDRKHTIQLRGGTGASAAADPPSEEEKEGPIEEKNEGPHMPPPATNG